MSSYRILQPWLSFIPRTPGAERAKALQGEVRTDLPVHGVGECSPSSRVVEGAHDWLLAQGWVEKVEG